MINAIALIFLFFLVLYFVLPVFLMALPGILLIVGIWLFWRWLAKLTMPDDDFNDK